MHHGTVPACSVSHGGTGCDALREKEDDGGTACQNDQTNIATRERKARGHQAMGKSGNKIRSGTL